ncbi:MAG: hypothetical protein QM780_09785 [Hyphomicrobium sp.]|uniref:hypothetical protein n=1 Tax=Hyphomicrobium sp. TaxID=82 RepID=UPI0039E52DA0
MLIYRAMAAAVIFSALMVSGPANAFETTSIGGTNTDGSAKYQDPDELGAATAPSTSSSPFGNFNFQVGTPASSDQSGTNWLNGPGSSALGFTGSQSTSAGPASPFNTPILRDRN